MLSLGAKTGLPLLLPVDKLLSFEVFLLRRSPAVLLPKVLGGKVDKLLEEGRSWEISKNRFDKRVFGIRNWAASSLGWWGPELSVMSEGGRVVGFLDFLG